jgi:hypothetical protein
MNAEQLTNPRSNVLTFPTFERFRVPTFNLQPRRSGATFNPLHLILEKKKIQITIEEQILTAFRLSPVARLRSVSQLCTVHGQWSIVNLQSSTFNFQPIAFDPQKRNSKKQTQIKSSPPAYTPSPSSYPHLYGSRA